ncbi:N-acetyltransferase family protein [Puia sp. P3]|uniref:GNAT family N-acetyltransferase n=1 Tax=Puia sp. P3 TaxID=3423952 RepID=UPI003D66AE16
MKNTLRPAVAADRDGIIALYKKVARFSGGLARAEDEITIDYVAGFMAEAAHDGVHFVMENEATGAIIGDIHCSKPGLKCFDHMLSDLTIAVDPDYQGQGIGKTLFVGVLDEVRENRKDILRVELLTGETNKRALAFYEGIGFAIEGRMPGRYRKPNGVLDADIPMAWMNPNFQA